MAAVAKLLSWEKVLVVTEKVQSLKKRKYQHSKTAQNVMELEVTHIRTILNGVQAQCPYAVTNVIDRAEFVSSLQEP